MSQLKSFNVSNEIMRAQKNGHAGSTLARVVWKKQFTSASHASSSAQADDPVYTDVSDESQGCGGCPAFAGHDGQRIDQQTPLLKSITSPHWRDYTIGASEIDTRRAQLLEAGEIDPATIEQEYLEANARYQ